MWITDKIKYYIDQINKNTKEIREIKEEMAIQKEIEFHSRISLKPIHLVRQSPKDFIHNLKKPDPVLLNALKSGCVLKGYEEIVEAVHKAQTIHGLFAVPEPEPR